MSRGFSSVPAAVDAISRGDVVIVVDDEGRENEGDFICAAEKATPENVKLIMRCQGDVCMASLPDVYERWDEEPLVDP